MVLSLWWNTDGEPIYFWRLLIHSIIVYLLIAGHHLLLREDKLCMWIVTTKMIVEIPVHLKITILRNLIKSSNTVCTVYDLSMILIFSSKSWNKTVKRNVLDHVPIVAAFIKHFFWRVHLHCRSKIDIHLYIF